MLSPYFPFLAAVAGGMDPSAAAASVEIGRASGFRILKAERAAQKLREAVAAGQDPKEAAKAAGVTWAAAKRVLGR